MAKRRIISETQVEEEVYKEETYFIKTSECVAKIQYRKDAIYMKKEPPTHPLLSHINRQWNKVSQRDIDSFLALNLWEKI